MLCIQLTKHTIKTEIITGGRVKQYISETVYFKVTVLVKMCYGMGK